eukprot:CAMPEP_0203772534 /NCGR_PEP_ID=MMETSP0099_2-20121227/4097_1 /ASSEMBLY_ACC=CAM_ASM_000209 /TAXON_ID=96639 /ORGANISM=" , Strain NY0313808BC1" /LENGTH=386 /DNA_ID=CAMNT_0050670147 /DNA_START=408 /DNA_END=1569 /DNA_ORIENTATION=+
MAWKAPLSVFTVLCTIIGLTFIGIRFTAFFNTFLQPVIIVQNHVSTSDKQQPSENTYAERFELPLTDHDRKNTPWATGVAVDRRDKNNFLMHFDGPLYLRNVFNTTSSDATCTREKHVYCHVNSAYSRDVHHPAHMIKLFFPCWSALEEHPDATRRFYLFEESHKEYVQKRVLQSRWIRDVFKLLDVDIVFRKVDTSRLRGCVQVVDIVQKITNPTYHKFLGRANCYGLKQAVAFRDRIVSQSAKQVVLKPRPLQIGVMDRKTTRKLDKPDEILRLLKQEYPNATVEYTNDIGTMTPQQQADWMYKKDIVISPHGQQMLNTAFMRKCAAVVEYYPKGFFVSDYFLLLPSNLHALAYAYYPGNQPLRDSEEVQKGPEKNGLVLEIFQ